MLVVVVDTSVDTDDGMGIVMMMDGDAAILIKSHIVPQTEIRVKSKSLLLQ